MGANALKGFGLGIATLGGEVGKGMMADTVERKRQESEARKEASLERRWRAELEASKAEREAGRAFEAGERGKDRTFRENESEKDRKQRESEEAGRNSRTDRQLELAERRSLTSELSDVRQQVSSNLQNLSMQAMRAAQKLEETMTGDKLKAAKAQLESQYNTAFKNIVSQGNAQHEQVLKAYPELGEQVAITFDETQFDGFNLTQPDPKVDPGAGNPPPPGSKTDPVTGKIVVLPEEGEGLFQQGFDLGAASFTAGYKNPDRMAAVQSADLNMDFGNYSKLDKLVEGAGRTVGRGVGALDSLYDSSVGLFTQTPAERKAIEQGKKHAMDVTFNRYK